MHRASDKDAYLLARLPVWRQLAQQALFFRKVNPNLDPAAQTCVGSSKSDCHVLPTTYYIPAFDLLPDLTKVDSLLRRMRGLASRSSR
jgi:hypothetical protein